ncbi:MAG: J domain-containing protein [Marinoscillum sp.]
MSNHYHTLGVSESASQSEIKIAFKLKAIQYHPDKHAGNPEMEELFKGINEAYQVLSNPYQKARYDIRLKYGQQGPSFQTYTYETSTFTQPRRRPTYVEPQINWRENWIATAYAFGFTFILAAIVMSGIGIKKYIDIRALEDLLAERRATFKEAQINYKNGQIESALVALNGLGIFRESERDMENYKDELFEDFVARAEGEYKKGIFNDAIYYYELIEDYGSRNPLSLKEHLAYSYRANHQPQKAIKKFTELILADYRKMECHLAIAVIYHKDLSDPQSSLPYYESASEYAIDRYESIYGNAYPLVLNGKYLPPEHYYLYTGLAEVLLETGNPEKAIKATKWNVNMWPDSADNYMIAARSLSVIGDHQKACNSLAIARALGATDQVNFRCR